MADTFESPSGGQQSGRMRHLPAVGWFVLAVAAAGALTVLAGLRLGAGAAIFAAGSSLAAVSIIAWVVFASRRAFVEAIDAAARSIKVRPDAGDPAETLRLIAAAFHRAQAGESDAAKELLSYRAMLDAVSEPVVALSPEGEVTWANAAAEGLFGREGGLIGTPIDALFTHPTMLDLHASAVRGAGRSERVRVALATGNRALHATAVPLREPGKQGHSVLMTLRDVTSLDAAVQVKTDFVANASHELRTPMASIQEGTHLLLDEIPGPLQQEQRTTLRIMADSSRRLIHLISTILDLSKMEAGMMEYRIVPTDLRRVADISVNKVRLLADSKHVQLLAEHPAERLWVKADAPRIEQVLDNLLSNALKFSPEGGIVKIQMRPDQKAGVLEVAVSDAGTGISAEDLPHIFERFYQGKNKAKNTSAGSGLGLALAKKVVEAHGGRIWIESEVGKGTTVRFILRLTKPGGSN